MRFIGVCLMMFLAQAASAHVTEALAQETIVMESQIYGGYVPSESRGWERGVAIDEFGFVVGYTRKNRNHERVYTTLGTLSSAVLEKIKEAISQVPSHEEVKFPRGPQCTDVPSRVYKTGGSKPIVFAERKMCKSGYLPSFDEGYTLKEILDGYEAQLQLLRQD